MIIDVFSDPICPWCYIGKRRLERALAENRNGGATVRWRAFQLNPEMPAGGMPRQTYVTIKFGGTERAAEFYSHVAAVGAGEGIEFDFDAIERTPNTVNAHRLIRYAAGRGRDDELVEALFRAYFLELLDIGDPGILADLAAQNGLDRGDVERFLNGTDYASDVRTEHDFAVSLNITGVPCFVVENSYVVTGAREPEAFGPIFDLVAEENRIAAES